MTQIIIKTGIIIVFAMSTLPLITQYYIKTHMKY